MRDAKPHGTPPKTSKENPIPPAPVPPVKRTTDDPNVADRFNRVLGRVVDAMEESGIRYLFIGGIASGGLGRPRSTHDIDLFVAPDDSELALRALAKHGFRTEKTDPSWLYKGFLEEILVDVIFKSKGEIYLDSEMYQRMSTAEFHGRRLRLVSPEDLLIIKSAAHSELTPGHWHDAVALLSHANLDWNYLLKRAKRAPRRVLSLLLYAQSNDIWVPNHVIHELYASIFGGETIQSIGAGGRGLHAIPGATHGTAQPAPTAPPAHRAHPQSHPQAHAPGQHQPQPSPQSSAAPVERLRPIPPSGGAAHHSYAVAHLRERLAEDPRTNELDIQIELGERRVLLKGETTVSEHRDATAVIAGEVFPGWSIENQIRVVSFSEPTEAEEVG